MQSKYIWYCLQLDKMTHISKNEFETLNWLPVKGRFNQFTNSVVSKYFTKQCLSYLNEVFKLACLFHKKITRDKTHSLSLVPQKNLAEPSFQT